MPVSVSLLVPMRNEERAIDPCLASIAGQVYEGRLEVWVIDGSSTDRSRDLVAPWLEGRPDWHLIDNPGRLKAIGCNLGIERATGEAIGIVDGHAELAPDYVARAVMALERTGATMVGGPMRAVGDTPLGRAIALATSTPFGVGGARFHSTSKEEESDTVYLGFCRAETYRRFRFDEEMVRDQDDELSYRIRDAGGRIVIDPTIHSVYHSRETLGDLWRQYYQYGYWKVRVLGKHPDRTRLRHLAPGVFAASLIVTLSAAPFDHRARRVGGFIVAFYAVANVLASLAGLREHSFEALPYVPLAYATLHLAYGFGFLAGMLRFGVRTPRR